MFPEVIRHLLQRKLSVRFETSGIHSSRRIRHGTRALVPAHGQAALQAALWSAVFAIWLACSPATISAAQRGRDHDRGSATLATLSVSATSLAFGNVSVNTAATQSITLTSTGTGTLSLTAATVSGSGFTVSGASFPLRLSPNQSATLTVQFDPATAGAVSGTLVLTSDSSTGASTIVNLSGTGVAAAVSTLSVNASTIAFGDVTLNSPSTQSLILTATGTAAVTVSSATVSGAGFSVSGATLPLTLAPSQTATLSVQFDPTAAGAASGMLTLTSNSSTGTSTIISLTGTGSSSAASGDAEVTLTWDAPASSTDPVAGYNVYRAPGGGTSYQELNTSVLTQTSYQDTTAQAGQTYDYIVESVDASGNTSAPSNMASVNVP